MEKIKEFLSNHNREIVIFLLVFLISSLSFGLGYLANQRFDRAQIVIEKCPE